MTVRLNLICAAPTAAARAARFPRDEPLGEAGAAALARAAPALSAAVAGVDRRSCAPERRARETAAALGAGFGVDEGLSDQDFGLWAGSRLADIASEDACGLGAWTTDPAAASHGGESVLALLARVEAWLAVQAAAGGRMGAVTHPALVRAAASVALGAGATGFWRIEAAPLTLAALTHDGRRWALAALVPPRHP